MKKFLIGSAAILAVAAPLTLAAASAQADAGSRRGYVEHVTRSEFNQAVPGMTAVQITRLFDIPGKMTYQGGGYQNREFWGWKSGDGERYLVEVSFRIGADSRWHLTSKSAYLPY